MRPLFYVLDDAGNPIPCEDVFEHARQMSDIGKRRVASTYLADDAIEVSTVFIGIDHLWEGNPPMLWETMIFVQEGVPLEDINHQRVRYCSREAALRGHESVCAYVQGILDTKE